MGNWRVTRKGAGHRLYDMTGGTQRRMRKILSIMLAVLMILVSPVGSIPAKAADEWTIVFDANGGSFANGTTLEVKIPSDQPITRPNEVPTLAGNALLGWSESGIKYSFSGIKTVEEEFGNTVYANDKKVTLKAIWEADDSKVLYDGGSVTDQITGKSRGYYRITPQTTDEYTISFDVTGLNTSTAITNSKFWIEYRGESRADILDQGETGLSYTRKLERGITYYWSIYNNTSYTANIKVSIESKNGGGLPKIDDCTVTFAENTTYVYNGQAHQPEVIVKDGNTTLVKGTHYTVDYSNNTNVGTAAVIVSGDGVHYTGGKTLNFTIGQGVAPNQPNSPMEITDDNVTKVSQISLEEYPGWIWRGSSENKELIVGSTVEAEVIYKSEADIKNYSNSPTTITITKPQKPLESITLDKSDITLLEGDKEQLTATLVPSDYVAAWSSTDSNIAEVSDKGLVTAKKAGTATITASAGTGNGKKTATCTVTVKAVPKADLFTNETSVEFGKLEYGYNTPASQTITIENAGDAEAENVTIELENGTDSKFTLDSGQTSVLKSIAAKNGSVNGKATISIAPKSGLSANKYSDKVNVKYGGSTLFSIQVTFEVTKKNVTITADNKTREYLGEDPEWSCQISPDVRISGITYSTDAASDAEVGEYTITVEVKGDNPNYNITTNSGKLMITPKIVTDVDFPKADPIQAGKTLADVQLSDTDSDYGEFAWKEGTESKVLSKDDATGEMVLTLSNPAKKNYDFTGVKGYDFSTGNTITRTMTLDVISANLPEITFPSVSSPVKYGDTLSSDILTTSPSEEHGTFDWKDKNITINDEVLANKQWDSQKSAYYIPCTLVFSWNLDKWGDILKAEGEPSTIEKSVRVYIEKADNNEVPTTAAIQVTKRSKNSIGIQKADNVEYSIDGVNWRSDNWSDTIDFYGLNASTPYTIYARYKETDTHNASASVSKTVYTLADNPYAIDLTRITNSEYMDSLYGSYVDGANNSRTVDYANGVLTLNDSGQDYILTGNAGVTVKTAGNGNYNITLNGTTINGLDVTNATRANITVSGTVTIKGEIISTTATEVNITVSGSLTATDIYVPEGSVLITGEILNIGTPVGKAGITAKNVKITDSTLTVTGGSGKPAIEGSDNVEIKSSTVTATAGAGASAIQGGKIILDGSDLQVEVDEDSDLPAIAAGDGKDIVERNNPSVSANTNNIYSESPKDDSGNTKSKATVIYLNADGSQIRSRTVDVGTSITLPTIEAKPGYKMMWKDQDGQSHEPGASVTVTKDMTFQIEEIEEEQPTKKMVTQIILSSTQITIDVNDTEALIETIVPEDADNTSVTWSTNKPSVAIVDQKGVVTGMAPGTAVITVKANDGSNVSATCTVTVLAGESENVDVDSIKITGDTKKVAPGKKLKLTATVYPENATNKRVTWKVNNTKYASVSSSGVVTTKKAGAGKTVTVIATSQDDGGITATYKISIMKKAVTKIKLSASKKTLKKGKSVTVKAKFTPASGISKELSWTTNKPKVATVNAKGKVTAKGKGKAKITAKAKDGSGKKATITITVK